MFYKTLKINGREYPIAVNITGDGFPFHIFGAVPGMIYFDETNKLIYRYAEDGSWKLFFDPDLEIAPSDVRKAGTYLIKVSRGSDDYPEEIQVYTLDENGGKIGGYYEFLWVSDSGTEATFAYNLEQDCYGLEIDSGRATVEAVYCTLETAIKILKAEVEQLGSISPARIGEVNLTASGWVAVQGSENLYSQVVELDDVTENSQVDLTPSVEQLAIFYNKDLAFVTENEDGVVTVYAIGQRPQNDYTIQVTITEVSV